MSKTLLDKALEARNNAYAPYSQKKVGAVIETQKGQLFSGCNVENASYGGTVCAERVAIFKAISELGTLEIKRVLVVTDSPTPWPPCGFCRQVIAEFSSEETIIEVANKNGVQKKYTLSELLPDSFTPKHLKSN